MKREMNMMLFYIKRQPLLGRNRLILWFHYRKPCFHGCSTHKAYRVVISTRQHEDVKTARDLASKFLQSIEMPRSDMVSMTVYGHDHLLDIMRFKRRRIYRFRTADVCNILATYVRVLGVCTQSEVRRRNDLVSVTNQNDVVGQQRNQKMDRATALLHLLSMVNSDVATARSNRGKYFREKKKYCPKKKNTVLVSKCPIIPIKDEKYSSPRSALQCSGQSIALMVYR